MERISKENYYLDIAETVLERATCLRRVYGAIIVKNDEIISTSTVTIPIALLLPLALTLNQGYTFAVGPSPGKDALAFQPPSEATTMIL